MPSNQLHQVNDSNVRFMKYVIKHNIKNYSSLSVNKQKIIDNLAADLGINITTGVESKFDVEKYNSTHRNISGTMISEDFIDLVYDALNDIIAKVNNGNEDAKENLPTFLSYGNFIVDKGDEKYTHIDLELKLTDRFNKNNLVK